MAEKIGTFVVVYTDSLGRIVEIFERNKKGIQRLFQRREGGKMDRKENEEMRSMHATTHLHSSFPRRRALYMAAAPK